MKDNEILEGMMELDDYFQLRETKDRLKFMDSSRVMQVTLPDIGLDTGLLIARSDEILKPADSSILDDDPVSSVFRYEYLVEILKAFKGAEKIKITLHKWRGDHHGPVEFRSCGNNPMSILLAPCDEGRADYDKGD